MALITCKPLTLSYVRHGFIAQYYPHSTQLQYKAEMVNNMRHGSYEEYHRNGNLLYKGTFLYNRPIGQCDTYYDSGQLEASMTFNGYGNLEGKHTTYYPDGRLMCKAYFVNGVFHDYYSVFDENGKLLLLLHYDHGKKHTIVEYKE